MSQVRSSANTMSAVDRGGDDEFNYSDEEVEYRESEDGGESGQERQSSSGEEEAGRPSTQPEDYTPLELAQRRRGRSSYSRRREQRGSE